MLRRAELMGETAVQVFVKSNRRWEMPKLEEGEAGDFQVGQRKQDLWVCSHAGYLINVAGSDETRNRSIQSLAEEIDRAEVLGLRAVVVHCGSRDFHNGPPPPSTPTPPLDQSPQLKIGSTGFVSHHFQPR